MSPVSEVEVEEGALLSSCYWAEGENAEIMAESRKESAIRLPESKPGVATVVLGRNFF